MYENNFSPLPEPDPLAIQVFLEVNERPAYVDAELANNIEAAVASCGDFPSPKVITLLAAAGVHIQERVRGKAADGHMAKLLCWSAIKHDRHSKGVKWFDGKFRAAISPYDIYTDEVRTEEGGVGYLGCLAAIVRKVLREAPEFVPYWFARQGPIAAAASGEPKPPTNPPPPKPKPGPRPKCELSETIKAIVDQVDREAKEGKGVDLRPRRLRIAQALDDAPNVPPPKGRASWTDLETDNPPAFSSCISRHLRNAEKTKIKRPSLGT